jgi:hypothetical protein
LTGVQESTGIAIGRNERRLGSEHDKATRASEKVDD